MTFMVMFIRACASDSTIYSNWVAELAEKESPTAFLSLLLLTREFIWRVSKGRLHQATSLQRQRARHDVKRD